LTDFWRADWPNAGRNLTNLFIQMNEVRRRASAWVQRLTRKVARMIDEPGPPTGHLVIPQ
jgi:hypothetical protein